MPESKLTPEATRRKVLGANLLDHLAKFLLELARKPGNEFTAGSRGVRLVAACKYAVDRHLPRTGDSSANSHLPAPKRTYTRRFRGLLGSLGTLLNGIGRDALTQILEERDEARASVEVGGEQLRYRCKSVRESLTSIGKIPVRRRTYRGDGPGAKSCTPLDALCGMQGGT